jgi:hypothetical protein
MSNNFNADVVREDENWVKRQQKKKIRYEKETTVYCEQYLRKKHLLAFAFACHSALNVCFHFSDKHGTFKTIPENKRVLTGVKYLFAYLFLYYSAETLILYPLFKRDRNVFVHQEFVKFLKGIVEFDLFGATKRKIKELDSILKQEEIEEDDENTDIRSVLLKQQLQPPEEDINRLIKLDLMYANKKYNH